MTDPARQHERPEAQPLADCLRAVRSAVAALQAAATLAPLPREAGAVHAALVDQAAAVERLQVLR